jgi:hypothetical protein
MQVRGLLSPGTQQRDGVDRCTSDKRDLKAEVDHSDHCQYRPHNRCRSVQPPAPRHHLRRDVVNGANAEWEQKAHRVTRRRQQQKRGEQTRADGQPDQTGQQSIQKQRV